MSKRSFFAAFLVLFFVFTGCAFTKGFLGIASIDNLKDRKQGRFSATYNLPYPVCYDRVLAIVKTLSTQILIQDKKGHRIGASNFDAVFQKCLDATYVGIFFVEKSRSETQVDTVSKNSKLSKFVLDQISAKIYTKPSLMPELKAVKTPGVSKTGK